MKALSIKHPWAEWIAAGSKTIETRTFAVSHRGPLLICSSKKLDDSASVPDEETRSWKYGHALAVADLVDVRPMTPDDEHAACCFYEKGRFAWVLENVRRIDPFPVVGRLGLFDVELPAHAAQG